MAARARNSRTVKEALRDNRWILGIAGDISANLALELVRLWTAMREVVQLNIDQEDCFTWPCSPTGLYSVKATYDRLWEGTIRFAPANCIWKCAKSSCG
jgi:hypothetical protein